MSQGKYVEEVLERFGIQDCKPIGTPLDTKVKLVKFSNEEYDADIARMASVPYKSAVGSLMYAMVATKPNLAFAPSCTETLASILPKSRFGLPFL